MLRVSRPKYLFDLLQNYCHQAPVTIGLGLIDVSSGLCKLNTRHQQSLRSSKSSVVCTSWVILILSLSVFQFTQTLRKYEALNIFWVPRMMIKFYIDSFLFGKQHWLRGVNRTKVQNLIKPVNGNRLGTQRYCSLPFRYIYWLEQDPKSVSQIKRRNISSPNIICTTWSRQTN